MFPLNFQGGGSWRLQTSSRLIMVPSKTTVNEGP
uniref:Uncharacterized protein n=1 Tax=Arundo donax TaxID=35708 RepID=A0A0A9FSK0_ARUDO